MKKWTEKTSQQNASQSVYKVHGEHVLVESLACSKLNAETKPKSETFLYWRLSRITRTTVQHSHSQDFPPATPRYLSFLPLPRSVSKRTRLIRNARGGSKPCFGSPAGPFMPSLGSLGSLSTVLGASERPRTAPKAAPGALSTVLDTSERPRTAIKLAPERPPGARPQKKPRKEPRAPKTLCGPSQEGGDAARS